MKHAPLAAVAVAALAFPGLAATATNTTHPSSAARATSAKPAARPVHQMLGAQLPFIRTGPRVGQGYVLRRNRSPRPQLGGGHPAVGCGPLDSVCEPNADDNLTYGGPDQTPPKALAGLPTVMTSSDIYSIFWVPNGYRTASNYISTIEQYWDDVSTDSYGSANADSTTVQYSGLKDGGILYDTSNHGYAVDTNPFPRSGCDKSYAQFRSSAGVADGHLDVHGLTSCLSDAQIEAEVKRFADSMGWAHGSTTEFFLYTPHNVGSCFYADGKVPRTPDNPKGYNTCAYDYYCAYHSEFGGATPSSEYIYANMPWPNQTFTYGGSLYATDCDAGEHPNGTGSSSNGTDPAGPTNLDAADQVINVSSHEHDESVTDPTGYGWWVDSYHGVDTSGNPIPDPFLGFENGDLCAWYWASDGSSYETLLAPNNSFVTNTVNGHPYFLQGEWSNGDATASGNSGCLWGYPIGTPNYTLGTNTLTAPANPGAGSVLVLTAGDFSDRGVYTYVWTRCSPDAVGTSRRITLPKTLAQLKAKRFALGNGFDIVQTDSSSTSATDTYTATVADVGNDIIGGVYKDNGTGDGTGEVAGGDSTPTVIPIGGEPEVNGTEPAITATPSALQPGTKLTLTLGAWTNTPTSFSVQWQHCDAGAPDSCSTFKTVKVPAARTDPTSVTYTLMPSDIHWAINAVVIGANRVGVSNYPGLSGLTDEVAGYPHDPDPQPAWESGSPVVGTADNVDFGTWQVPAGASVTGYSVVVKRCPLLTDPITIPDFPNCEVSTTLTATGSRTSVAYMPVADDLGQALVAEITAKNKYGSSNVFVAYTTNTVGGNPVDSVAPTWEETTAASGADTSVTLDFGTWSPAATEYRYTVFACDNATDTTTCQKLGTLRAGPGDNNVMPTSVAWKGSAGGGIDNLNGEYFLRGFVQAINGVGFSAGVWTDNAVDVDATS